ncbi:MAG: glycosyltransferase family 4 protein, partial [Candidatus Omnitrophica bacterium]|nr:glycosyltransferase family 4 protein [Candidatus Omnitrophota bacterium]
MKICVITKELYPFRYDGIGVQAYNQALLLAQNGHEVSWLSQVHTNYDESRAAALYPGISLEFFNYEPEKFLSHKPLDYAVQAEEAFARLHAQKRFDAILTFDFEAECFCICKKRLTEKMYSDLKIIVTLEGPAREVARVNHGLGTTPWGDAVFEAEDFSLLMSDAVISCSQYLWEQVNARLPLSGKPAKVIPNMCRLDLFKVRGKEFPPCERGLPPLREIIFVGRLEKRKGADLLLMAFLDLLREYPRALDYKLVFVGRDLFWDDLHASFIENYLPKIPEDLRDRFEFCGQLSHQDVALRLQKAVFGVFPSRWEPFGIAALEALSSGVPVIVSRGTGLDEIVGKDYPFLFDLKQGVPGLKDLLRRLIAAEDQWASLSDLATGIAKEVNRKSREDFLEFLLTVDRRE